MGVRPYNPGLAIFDDAAITAITASKNLVKRRTIRDKKLSNGTLKFAPKTRRS